MKKNQYVQELVADIAGMLESARNLEREAKILRETAANVSRLRDGIIADMNKAGMWIDGK